MTCTTLDDLSHLNLFFKCEVFQKRYAVMLCHPLLVWCVVRLNPRAEHVTRYVADAGMLLIWQWGASRGHL